MKTCQLVRFLEASAEQYGEAAREDRANLIDHAQEVYRRFMAERSFSQKGQDQKQLRVLDKAMAKTSERGLGFTDSFEFLMRAVIEPRYREPGSIRRGKQRAIEYKAQQSTPPPFYEPPRSVDSVLYSVAPRPTLSTFLNSPHRPVLSPPELSSDRASRHALELSRPHAFCVSEEAEAMDFVGDATTCIDPSLLSFESGESAFSHDDLESMVFVEIDRLSGSKQRKTDPLFSAGPIG